MLCPAQPGRNPVHVCVHANAHAFVPCGAHAEVRHLGANTFQLKQLFYGPRNVAVVFVLENLAGFLDVLYLYNMNVVLEKKRLYDIRIFAIYSIKCLKTF